MSSNLIRLFCLLACFSCICLANEYNNYGHNHYGRPSRYGGHNSYGYGHRQHHYGSRHNSYGSNYGDYSRNYGDYVKPYETAEAEAAAQTNAAGAAAAAAKLDATDRYALNRYGFEQARPLLSKPYGPLDKLYAAALPPRSFVAEIDPVFKKRNYGGYYGEKTISLDTGAKLAVTVA